MSHDNETPRVDPTLVAGNRTTAADYRARHFGWDVVDHVATVTLNRPERKNPLTFDSYAELRDLFGQLKYADAQSLARELAEGPTFANGITKTMLHQAWSMGLDRAIESEAQAQAICMLTEDFARAYVALAAKRQPRFEGN